MCEVAQGVGVRSARRLDHSRRQGLFTDYHYEVLLKEVGLHLKAQRKKRSKRPMAPWEEFLSKPTRQYIETVFSNLSALFARKIHAVTPRGFELKIVCFLLAFSIQCL